ncbi:MAG: hypothetical protein L6Q37_00350 [Bdellovibrionaceae bacterium]|nr:hypothetical protein [Pseudobdellovibrionaceae bacterium]NUM58874.1 hypothetical protein [Pseudobdellovibrionaceae bacterium]
MKNWLPACCFIIINFATFKALPAADDRLLYPPIEDKRFCESAVEFKRAFEFFSKEKELDFNEPRSIKAAIDVAKNCTGAFERFQKVFLLLKKSGVELTRAFEVSLEYSGFDNERAKNFFVLFQKLFLENYLNLDFTTAYKLANGLSKDYKGDPIKLRDDFVKIVDLCTAEKQLSLDKKTCAQLALNLTKYTELFPKGVFEDFNDIIKYVQSHKRLGLNIKDTLNLAQRVISKGPKAPTNFKKIIAFTLEENSLKLTEIQAFQLALVISDLSFNDQEDKKINKHDP